jgi:hypothetical protein
MTTLEQQLRPAGRPKNRFSMSATAFKLWKETKAWGPDPRSYLADAGVLGLDDKLGVKVSIKKVKSGLLPYFYANLQTADGKTDFTLPGVLHTDDFPALVEKWGLFGCEWSDVETAHYEAGKPPDFPISSVFTGAASAGYVWLAVLADEGVRIMCVRGWTSQLPGHAQLIGLLGRSLSDLPDRKLLEGHFFNEVGPKSTELMNALYERSRAYNKRMFLDESGYLPHAELLQLPKGKFKL